MLSNSSEHYLVYSIQLRFLSNKNGYVFLRTPAVLRRIFQLVQIIKLTSYFHKYRIYQIEKTGIRVITLCPGLTETALTVDSPNKLLSRVMKADFVKTLDQLSIQT